MASFIVALTGFLVVLSVVGFAWMNKIIAQNSVNYFSQLDLSSMTGAATAAGAATLVAVVLYYINYPEGQLARDASAGFAPPKIKKTS